MKVRYFAGIDVQVKRGCSYYVLDESNNFVSNGWVESDEIKSFPKIFSEVVNNDFDKIAIGIDAPRMPLKKPRTRYYNKMTNSWTTKEIESIGRECEVIINSHKIANCQWTPTLDKSPEWMKLGYQIFKELKNYTYTYEVFPSASYKMLQNEKTSFQLCLNNFSRGVKDMIDAAVAAITVKEFVEGKGCEIGGEDQLGTIILPRKIKGL